MKVAIELDAPCDPSEYTPQNIFLNASLEYHSDITVVISLPDDFDWEKIISALESGRNYGRNIAARRGNLVITLQSMGVDISIPSHLCINELTKARDTYADFKKDPVSFANKWEDFRDLI